MQLFGLAAHSGLHHVHFSHHELNCSKDPHSANCNNTDINWAFFQSKSCTHARTSIATQTYYGLSTAIHHLPFELRGSSPAASFQLLTVAHSVYKWSQWVQIPIRVTQETHLQNIGGHSGVKYSCSCFQITGPCCVQVLYLTLKNDPTE